MTLSKKKRHNQALSSRTNLGIVPMEHQRTMKAETNEGMFVQTEVEKSRNINVICSCVGVP